MSERAINAVLLVAIVGFVALFAVDWQAAPEPKPKPGPAPTPQPEPEPEPAPAPKPRVLEWHADKADALAEAEKIGGVVVGYYARPNCPYCVKLRAEYLETVQFRRRCIESRIVPYFVSPHPGPVPVLEVCSPDACVEPLKGWRGVEVTDNWLRTAAGGVR